ncbi:MAG: VWA domain-containing protein [Rhodobiaceae bacterium]|nr:VWA domain-containing protein [Rhodobiaceae bacterium]
MAVAAFRVLAAIGEFRRNRQGNIAITFAVALMPIIAAAGVAVDLARAYGVRAHVTQALDAAGLAVAGSPGASEDYLEALAQDYFDANYPSHEVGVPGALQLSINGSVVTLSATATLPTALLGVFGIHEVDVGSAIEVTRENKALEVVMVLDNTGSMGSNGKLDAMKEAATSLVDILYGEDPDLDKLHIGLVPFAAGVNVGTNFPTSALDMTGASSIHKENFKFSTDPNVNNLWDLYDEIENRSWGGCVQTRPQPLDELDTPPSAGTPDTLWVPWFAPDEGDASKYVNDYLDDADPDQSDKNEQKDISKYDGAWVGSSSKGPDAGCTMQPVTPLTNDRERLLDDIDTMNASGVTHIPVGLSWGWRLISPEEPFTEGREYDDADVDKAIVLLTDGSNVLGTLNNRNRSRYTAYGYIRQGRLGTSNKSAAEARLDPKTADICENIKDEGVRLYTITFQVSSTDTQELMEECATSPALYFDSPDNEQLQTIFQAIARDLSNLRLSK